MTQRNMAVTIAVHDQSKHPRDFRRDGHFALAGLGRVDFAVGPAAPDGDESADGFVVFESELYVSTPERGLRWAEGRRRT